MNRNYYIFFFEEGKRRKTRKTRKELLGKKEKLYDLVKSGMSVSEASNELGLAKITCYKWLENTGIEKKGQPSKTKELSSEIIRLREDGYGYREIARILNIDRNAVRTWCRNNNAQIAEWEGMTDKYISDTVATKDYTYIGGYKSNREGVTVKCNRCGTVQEKAFYLFRKSSKHRPICPGCRRKENLEREKQREKQKIEEKNKREALKIEKQEEIERRKLLLKLAKRLRSLHECPECGKMTFRKKYCSKTCSNRVSNKNHWLVRDRKIKSVMIDNDITVNKLYRKENGICHICGKHTDLTDYKVIKNGTIVCGNNYPSIDHIIPLAKGGLHAWSNVHLAHRLCNSVRGAN